jgi:branched-subunit amino acid aminotransferase/4-amino-4-deoxychorismate lyase
MSVRVDLSFDSNVLGGLALGNYGHFTTMCVEGGRVRGLPRHIERLVRDCRALFSLDIDRTQVTEVIRRALGELGGAGLLRITLFARGFDIGRPAAAPEEITAHAVMRPSPAAAPAPLRLRTVTYGRECPEVKHVGIFGALHQRRAVQLAGFDDALFLEPDGTVTEGSTWNIGFVDDDHVVWPTGPALRGVTMELLQEVHRPFRAESVTRDDVARMRAAFATNAAYGVRPISSIDDHALDPGHPLLARLRTAYDGLEGTRVAGPALSG